MSPIHARPNLTAMINGRRVGLIEFEVTEHAETARSLGPRQDPHWEMVDSNGHYHAYSTAVEIGHMYTRYPTLDRRSETVPCDGTCDGVCEGNGSQVDKYSCRLCREDITPGLIKGPYTFTVATITEWTMVATDVPGVPGDEVSVRLSDGRFGVATIVNKMSHTVFGESHEDTRYELLGNGQLGVRIPPSQYDH